jgi:ParB family transcriptional regulator, chromosome partitioning protein
MSRPPAVLGAIDLDPASCDVANTVVRAQRIYTVEDDGLEQPWQGRVWMNPPYAQPAIGQFSRKFAHHVHRGDVSAGIALVNNGTETEWFRALADCAAAVCFPSSRVRFWHPERETSTPLQGQAVFYAGPDRVTFGRHFSEFGLIWVRP